MRKKLVYTRQLRAKRFRWPLKFADPFMYTVAQASVKPQRPTLFAIIVEQQSVCNGERFCLKHLGKMPNAFSVYGRGRLAILCCQVVVKKNVRFDSCSSSTLVHQLFAHKKRKKLCKIKAHTFDAAQKIVASFALVLQKVLWLFNSTVESVL